MLRGRPKEKYERALGERLHLKGERCDSPKCAAVRKPYRPGMHGKKRRRRISDYGKQLQEKQKFKISYGMTERTLRRLFNEAHESSESTADKLLELMERRLDNVVYRLGLAPSRAAARQSVVHGHVQVNGSRVKAPSYQVAQGDVVSIHPNSREYHQFNQLSEKLDATQVPSWLSLVVDKLEGTVVALPEEKPPFEIHLLVESFSK